MKPEKGKGKTKGKSPFSLLYSFTTFYRQETGTMKTQKTELISKPEAMSVIIDGLQEKGLYQPEDLSYIPEIDGDRKPQKKGLTLTLDQYGELQKRSIDAGLSGDWKRAEHIRGIMNRHAPAPMLRLKAVHTTI